MPSPRTIRLCLAADFAVLAELRSLVLRLSHEAGLSEIESNELALAIDEAATNIIEHTVSTEGCDLNCTMRSDPIAHAVMIDILYKAPGLFEQRTPPTADEIEARVRNMQRGGLGVYLIHNLVDGIEYSHDNGENMIRVVKRHGGE